MDERERRLGENEALFRHVNERIKEIGESFSLVSTHTTFVCECADPACTEQLALRLEEYAAIRANPERFLIVPGHEAPDVEEVVEHHGRYAVVEKRAGGPAALARETAPDGQ